MEYRTLRDHRGCVRMPRRPTECYSFIRQTRGGNWYRIYCRNHAAQWNAFRVGRSQLLQPVSVRVCHGVFADFGVSTGSCRWVTGKPYSNLSSVYF